MKWLICWPVQVPSHHFLDLTGQSDLVRRKYLPCITQVVNFIHPAWGNFTDWSCIWMNWAFSTTWGWSVPISQLQSTYTSLSGEWQILKSTNSNCNQQVDIDWTTTSLKTQKKVILIWLTVINASKGCRNNIIMLLFKRPQFMLMSGLSAQCDKQTTFTMFPECNLDKLGLLCADILT